MAMILQATRVTVMIAKVAREIAMSPLCAKEIVMIEKDAQATSLFPHATTMVITMVL